MAGSLGVGADRAGIGLSAKEHRKIIDAQWVNTGIVKGCEVTGRSDMRYQVSEGVAVCQRLTADGKTLSVWAGGPTPEVPAADSANPRIDCVYMIAYNQPENKDDPNTQTAIEVAVGTPATNPALPALPAGATPLRYMRLPAKAVSTQSATAARSPDYAIPYGANIGRLARAQITQNWELSGSNWQSKCKTSFNLPTDRQLRLSLNMNFSAKGSRGGTDTSKVSEVRVKFRIDNNDVGPVFNFPSWGAWESHTADCIVNCGRGNHTVEVLMFIGYGQPAQFHYSGDGNHWVGCLLEVHDAGPDR